MISYYFYFATLEKSGCINVISRQVADRTASGRSARNGSPAWVSATETPLKYLDPRRTSNAVF
jgi:hypothetical protein